MWRRRCWLLLTPDGRKTRRCVPLPGGRQDTPGPSTARAGASPTAVGAGCHSPKWPVTTRFRPHPQRPGWPDTASCPFRRRARSARGQSETRAGASGASADCRHAASPAALLFSHGTRYGPRGLPGPVRPRLDPVSHAKTPFTNEVPPIGADEEGVGGQGPRTGPAPLEPPPPIISPFVISAQGAARIQPTNPPPGHRSRSRPQGHPAGQDSPHSRLPPPHP